MNLRQLRKSKGISAKEMSEIIGCSIQQLTNFENKRSPIPPKYIRKIAHTLDMNEQIFVDFIVDEYRKKVSKKL